MLQKFQKEYKKGFSKPLVLFTLAEIGQSYPYLLTKAGSVFVLHVAEKEKAELLLTNWLANGLHLPEWVKAKYKNDKPLWDVFPFVRENGFGEINVNLKWHWDNRL